MSGTQAVGAAAVSATVLGTFVLPYQVAISTSWNTSVAISGKTLAQFVVTFGTPAPAGGGTLDWTVTSAAILPPPPSGAITLQAYLSATQRLLRDESTGVYSLIDLTAWINQAMQQRDLDLGINRSRISFAMTAAKFQYTFAEILAGGTVLTGPASPNVIDIASIIIVPLGAATSSPRYPLGRWPYSKLAFLLATSYPTYPVHFAIYGPGTIMVGPPPAANYPTEWDFTAYSSALVNLTDADPVPYPWTDPVPFMAASLAKTQSQRFDEAKEFEAMYMRRLARVMARGRPFAVSNPWADLPRGAR